jgi:hypothetical protein
MIKKKVPIRTATKPDEETDAFVEIDPANEISEDDFELGAMMTGYGDDVEKFREDCGGDPHWNPYYEESTKAKGRAKRHLANSVKGTSIKPDKDGRAKAKRDGIKKAIRETKLAMKDSAKYMVVLKKEQVKVQRSLERAERNLAGLKARLGAALRQ